MFGLGLDIEQLKERAVKVGADVPYCLMRGTMLATGIGEKLDRLPPMPQCAIVVAKPPVNVSTRMVYEKLDMSSDIRHPDIDAVIRGLENGDLVQIAESMGNVLEDVTIPMHPVIDTIKRDMKRFGAINAMMSGSGPTVFGIFDDKQQAQICLNHMREQGSARQAYITDVYNVRQI
jgi:4-diphosphocytidyl-2-C-methyl-D-erythritol kinase